jgi:hypothetical protein
VFEILLNLAGVRFRLAVRSSRKAIVDLRSGDEPSALVTMRRQSSIVPAHEIDLVEPRQSAYLLRRTGSKSVGMRRVGFMSQAFSRWTELTVQQNLLLHVRFFDIPGQESQKRVNEMLTPLASRVSREPAAQYPAVAGARGRGHSRTGDAHSREPTSGPSSGRFRWLPGIADPGAPRQGRHELFPPSTS